MKKILSLATSFAFAASLAFAALTLPFFAGQASAQAENAGPGAFWCGQDAAGAELPAVCQGEEVVIECFEGCDVEITVPVTTTIEYEILMTYIITDGVVELKEFVGFADCCPVVGDDVGPHEAYRGVDGELIDYQDQIYATYPLAAFGGPAGAEGARLIEQAEADAEDAVVAAAANALLLQQAEEEKACRGVPLALKHLLCAAKI
jgi:hypothetical protein